MANQFHLNITTPGKTIYDGRVISLVAPGELGYLGILANHAPLITTLVPGKVVLRNDQDKTSVFYSDKNGFLEVLKNSVTLLLDSVES